MRLLAGFLKNESGATAIEYALNAAGIGIAIIAGVNALGTAINTKFDDIKDIAGLNENCGPIDD